MDEEGKGRGNFFNIALTTNSNLQTRGREGGWEEYSLDVTSFSTNLTDHLFT